MKYRINLLMNDNERNLRKVQKNYIKKILYKIKIIENGIYRFL